MALPNVPYAATTNPQMQFLDATFAAVAALGVIPCTVGGTANAIVLTGASNTPTLAAYANYQQFSFVAASTPNGDVTVQFSGLGALKLYRPGQPTTQATTGDFTAGALLVIAYNSALDGANGGFQLVSAVQPAIAPASAVQVRAATDGSTALTPANILNSPFAMAASATVGSGGVITDGHGLIGQKTGLGTWSLFFTSGRAPLASTYQVWLTNGDPNTPNNLRVSSQMTSGFSVISRTVDNSASLDVVPFFAGVTGNF